MSKPDIRWEEFFRRLGGPEGCNFRESNGETTWDCMAGTDQSLARAILEMMGYDEQTVAAVLSWCSSHGGYCDCEILFNVDPQAWAG